MKDEKKKQEVVELDARDILNIKSMAHNNFVNHPVKPGAADDIRSYYLFDALHSYLLSKGVNPGFKLK